MALTCEEIKRDLENPWESLVYEDIAECWENYEIIKVGTQYFKVSYDTYEGDTGRYIEDVTEVKPVEVKSIYWEEV